MYSADNLRSMSMEFSRSYNILRDEAEETPA
jgi:hypothetical protein